MRTIKTLLIGCLLGIGIQASAQTGYRVPANYRLEQKGDYMRYKQDVLDATEYLKKTPLGKDTANRRAVSTFLALWIMGSPDISVVLTEPVTEPLVAQGELFTLYMAAWTSHVLRTGDTTAVTANIAAARAVLAYYKDPINKVPLNKKLEMWQRKDGAGVFDNYITELFRQQNPDK